LQPSFTTRRRSSTSSSNCTGPKNSHDVLTRGQPTCIPSCCIETLRPTERKKPCSTSSIIRKKLEKCAIPAMSVSANWMRRRMENDVGTRSKRKRQGDKGTGGQGERDQADC